MIDKNSKVGMGLIVSVLAVVATIASAAVGALGAVMTDRIGVAVSAAEVRKDVDRALDETEKNRSAIVKITTILSEMNAGIGRIEGKLDSHRE